MLKLQIPKKSSILADLLIILSLNFVITGLVWLPFILRLPNFLGLNFSEGFQSIYRNYDGLEYVVIAKSFYIPSLINNITASLPASYFPSHFPLYSLFIILFAPVLGYLKSMLFTSILFTIFSAYAFYFFIKDFELTEKPLFLTLLFLLLPARWIIVHSVGSAEPVFIFFSLITIYFFQKFEVTQKYYYIWLSTLGLVLTQFTRPPALLIFLALFIYLGFKYLKKQINLNGFLKYYPLILGPLSILLMFYYFQITLGDFWAYFHTGDNIHFTLPPYAVFNKNQFWVGDIWLEDIIYIFILGFSAGVSLLRSKMPVLGYLVLVYLTATIFIAHRDVARYTLPIVPFILISFNKFLITKEFKIVLIILILGFYLYSENFLIANTAPIANLGIYN